MKDRFLLFLIFLIINSLCVHAQVTNEQVSEEMTASKDHWLIALSGGVAFQRALPNYSVNSPNLTNGSANASNPYLKGKFGYRFQNKHQVAFILEKTVASNSFTFLGDFDEGLGLNRGINYILANLEYSYNLLNAKRFWLAPSIQFGIGFGSTNSSAFFDQGRETNFFTPEGLSYHKYDIVQNDIPSHIYNFGLGIDFDIEVIDSRFIVGTELRWLYSFNAVHEYEINYQYDVQELNFTVNSPLSNINLGLKLIYLF